MGPPSVWTCAMSSPPRRERWRIMLRRAVSRFDDSGIERGADGIARYVERPSSLVAMLRATVEAHPDLEAIVELGGERLTYQQLWDRSARVAGGLDVSPGDRVAIRLGNGTDWVLAFFGAVMAGAGRGGAKTPSAAGGGRQHALRRGGGQVRPRRLGRVLRLRAGCRAARRRAVGARGRRPG